MLRDDVGAEEGGASGERFEQRHAQRVKVGGRADGGAGDLLGRHVRDRADQAAGLRLAEVDQVGGAEVAELGVAGGVEEDVGRLDVAVDDAALMRGVQRRQQLQRQPPPRRRRQRAARGQPILQRAAGHQLEHEQTQPLVHVVQRDDVGVAQAARGLGLAREAEVGLALGTGRAGTDCQQLDRDVLSQQRVVRQIDAPHRARAQQLADAEAPPQQARVVRRAFAARAGAGLGLGGRKRLGRRRQLGRGAAQPRQHVGRGGAQPQRQQLDHQRVLRLVARGRGATRLLQHARRLVVAAETPQQAPERQARRRRLGLAAVGGQALVKQARLVQFAGQLEGAPLVERGVGAVVVGGGAREVEGALGGAPRLERPPASREGVRGGDQLGARVVRNLGRDRARARGVARVQAQAQRQRAIAQRQRQRHGVGEAPDALVKLDRAPGLAALDAQARRLDVGAVRHEVFDDVLTLGHSVPSRRRFVIVRP